MAVPAGERIEVFYVTDEQPSWVQDQSVQLTSTTDEMTDYVVRVSRSWTGNLQQLRVDPTANTGISFTVESVSLLSEKPSLITKTKMTVNEMDFIIKAPSAAYDGETYIAYDLSTALDYRLAAYTDWRFKTGVLSITANGHTAVFTVGSRYYTADGITRTLPHEVYLEDGLPMIPVKALCGSLGFTCTVEGNHVGIRTHQYDYFTSIAAIPKGCFEFNNIGFTEGWGSSMMNLHVGKEGYMTLTCTSSNDPTSNYTLPSPMVAADYKTLTIRCRWSMENRTSDVAAMYFITDRDSTWNEAKNIRLSLPRQSSGGEFVVLTAKLANYKTWTDNITALRFDPFNAHGVMDIDYIRFE